MKLIWLEGCSHYGVIWNRSIVVRTVTPLPTKVLMTTALVGWRPVVSCYGLLETQTLVMNNRSTAEHQLKINNWLLEIAMSDDLWDGWNRNRPCMHYPILTDHRCNLHSWAGSHTKCTTRSHFPSTPYRLLRIGKPFGRQPATMGSQWRSHHHLLFNQSHPSTNATSTSCSSCGAPVSLL